MINKGRLQSLVGVCIAFSQVSAFAQRASDTSSSSLATRLLPKASSLYIGIRSENFGPSIVNWNSKRPDWVKGTSTSTKDAIRSEDKVTLAYRFNSDVSAGVAIEAAAKPVSGFALRDPFLVARHAQLLHSVEFNTDASFRVYLPVTADSRAAHGIAGLRFVQDSTYRIAKSAFVAGLYAYAHFFIAHPYISGGTDQRYTVIPYVNYELSPKVTLQVSAKQFSRHSVPNRFLKIDSDPLLVGPGVLWNVTKNVLVNPFIDFAPSNGFSLKTAAVGLFLNWRIL